MPDEAAPPVLSDVRDGVATITLNRPGAANALSRELVGGLGQALSRARADDGVRAVILTGAGGKAFCAGADLKERRAMTLEETRSFLRALNAVVDAVASFPRPVIAALNGAAFGGGLELALACDFRLAADTAELGLVETRLGIIPGAGGTQRLTRAVGVTKAMEMCLTGETVSGLEAKSLGLVNNAVPSADVIKAAEELASRILKGAPTSVMFIKEAIKKGVELPLEEGLRLEADLSSLIGSTEDAKEGPRAFAEKRAPVWKGK